MKYKDTMLAILGRMNPRWVAVIEKILWANPAFNQAMHNEVEALTTDLYASLKPYRNDFRSYECLPPIGRDRDEILAEMQAIIAREDAAWRNGFVSGGVYHGDDTHIKFLNQVCALQSQANPLHADIWPSISKYEAEIVSMTAHMMTAGTLGENNDVCGTVTSGGTESILLAMRSYRDWAREHKGITRPEMVLPVTAHAAFDKASQYFNIKPVLIPVDSDFKADINAARKAITRNTVVLVGSAPSFPHGIIDPIQELSELAQQRGIGFHTDACLGGFLLPWAERLGYPIPPFDFRLPGVTSISADTHKYGYAPKGTSVVLYRSSEMRHYQYYTASEWPGGMYVSPTIAGSRPGALSAACWAAMVNLGEEGYLEAARKILQTAVSIRQAIESIPDLYVLGDPLFVIAFGSRSLDIYQVMEHMCRRGWNLNRLHKPISVHLCVTLSHTQPGVAEHFIADLEASVEETRLHPEKKTGMAPIYGMTASLPLRGVINDVLKKYIDTLYKV